MAKKTSLTGKYFVIILLGIVVAVIIFSFNFLSSRRYETPPSNPEITKIKNQSQDTEIESIEKDLQSTDFNNLDSELQNIESELQTSL